MGWRKGRKNSEEGNQKILTELIEKNIKDEPEKAKKLSFIGFYVNMNDFI